MRKGLWLMACLAVLAAGLGRAAFCEVEPHDLFTDNMVLQRGMEVPVWGYADRGERVTVRIQDQSASAEAEDGKWMVVLDPLREGGPYTMTIEGTNTVELENVLVGEVWVCSGQSNMQWTVRNSNNPDEEIRNASYPRIRLFSVPRVVAGEPQERVDGEWVECSPETVETFSAVGYYFGRYLHGELDAPIGLIHTSWGGTPAESWTTWGTLAADEDFQPILERWRGDMQNFVSRMEELDESFTNWWEKAEAAELSGRPVPAPPSADIPRDPRSHPWRPSGLYNAMISPLVPYGIRGAIWYQGESNAGRAWQYGKLFPAMIRDWRREWGQGDFPFLFVQLANFIARRDYDGPAWKSPWAELREAQLETLSLPNTGMAVTTDIGDPDDIHPRNKQDVGKRLALNALKIAYGKSLVHAGPLYRSMEREGNKIRLRFGNTGGGLTTLWNEKVKGFVIAGGDGEFEPATARIEGDTVVVWSDGVTDPAAVRYAWADNPDGNLYNDAQLPASPFRTDDWKGETADAR